MGCLQKVFEAEIDVAMLRQRSGRRRASVRCARCGGRSRCASRGAVDVLEPRDRARLPQSGVRRAAGRVADVPRVRAGLAEAPAAARGRGRRRPGRPRPGRTRAASSGVATAANAGGAPATTTPSSVCWKPSAAPAARRAGRLGGGSVGEPVPRHAQHAGDDEQRDRAAASGASVAAATAAVTIASSDADRPQRPERGSRAGPRSVPEPMRAPIAEHVDRGEDGAPRLASTGRGARGGRGRRSP